MQGPHELTRLGSEILVSLTDFRDALESGATDRLYATTTWTAADGRTTASMTAADLMAPRTTAAGRTDDVMSTATNLHATTDARVWAAEFYRIVGEKIPAIREEEEWIFGWFANAIEVGRGADDHRAAWAWDRVKVLEGQRRADVATIARLRAHLAAAGLALDELTAPASAPAKVSACVRYIDAETGKVVP